MEKTQLVSVCQEYNWLAEEPYYIVGNAKIYLKEENKMEKRIAKQGMEDLFELVQAKYDNLENEKAQAIADATFKIGQEYAEKEKDFVILLDATSDVVEEEQIEETVKTNATEDFTENVVE